MGMDEIADRLDALPALRRSPEERPSQIRQLVRLAVATSEQEDEMLGWQVGDLDLDRVGGREVLDDGTRDGGICRESHDARWGRDPAAQIAETIDVGLHRHG